MNGYYVLVAMTVNVDRTPIPNGGSPPMPATQMSEQAAYW